MSKEEASKVDALHNNLTETLVNFREETSTIEDSLRVTADALKKQLKDEAHARTVLQARIAADNTDLQKTSVESTKKREKVNISQVIQCPIWISATGAGCTYNGWITLLWIYAIHWIEFV